MRQRVGVAASVLCAPLLDGPSRALHVAHRSRLVWQLVDDKGFVACCVIFPGAIRLPHAIAVQHAPSVPPALSVGDGALGWGSETQHVARWWRPARPRIDLLRGRVSPDAAVALHRRWRDLLGRGDGLTPYGDDVVCGALVALHAAGHELAATWSADMRSAPLERHTTATSAALLRAAADGWCLDEVADYLNALAHGVDLPRAEAMLRSVGHSSGRGLLEGISTVITNDARAAA